MAIALDGTSQSFLSSVFKGHSLLASTQVHPTYIPISIFAVIHATRIACAYRGAARAGGYEARLSLLQSMLAPCILIFGGTTITGAILGIVPGWVISPLPVITYGVIPVVAAKFGVTSLLLALPALPRDLLFSTVDGFSRVMGITTLGLDTVLAHSNPAVATSPWAMVVIATLAGGGGGLIIPAIKGFHADWEFTTPLWVKEGPGIDVWGATVIGYVYATLIDAHPFFRQLPSLLLEHIPILASFVSLPKAYLTSSTRQPLVPNHEAKIACALLLAAMLCTKTLLPYLGATLKSRPKALKVHATPKPSQAVAPKKPSSGKAKEKKSQ